MADQTQRLEIATVRAEVGSNIVYRFANDAVNADSIPTQTGDIQNLKQILLEIQQDAAEKISISTTIYPSVAAGLAATADQGIFLVQSNDADEIYAVWQNQGGTAVNTGKTALSATAIQTALDASNEAAQAAEDAAEVATNRTAGFLSPSSVAPILRDNGLPLQVGDRYFNTEAQFEYIYTDSGWEPNDSLEAINEFMARLEDTMSVENGSSMVGTRLPSQSLLAQAIGRALTEKLYDTVSIKDFVIFGDPVQSSPETADWYPTVQRCFTWAQQNVIGKARGVNIMWPAMECRMSQQAVLDLAPAGTQNTGAVGINIYGAGTGQTIVVAMPTNTTGCFRLTSGRNMELFQVTGISFLSDLDEDAPTNNGIALVIDSALKRGDVGYGDQPRWSVILDDIYIGGYGKTAGNVARRGNWLKGINIKDKYHPKLSNIRCLARYSNIIGARTACEYAIHFEACYSPDMWRMYIHGGWNKGIWLDDVFNIVGGYEDMRLANWFVAGSNYGIGVTHEFDNRPDTTSLYEPGGAITVGHLNCRKVGITIRHHRQVIISDIYAYVAREDRADGELLPSIILLDGAADIQISGQFFEPGFYNSDSNASCAVRIEGASEGITVDAQFGNGGIGVLNNSTYTTRKTIVVNAKLQSSRRLTTYPTFKLIVDNSGTVTAFSNLLQNSQDRHTMSSGKPSPTHPVAHRLTGLAPGQLYGGAYEIACVNSLGVETLQALIQGRFTDATAGAEISSLGLLVNDSGVIREAMTLRKPTVDNDGYPILLFRTSSTTVAAKRVKMGPANSGPGGVGRALYVDN
ncbi:hypothetical protein H4B97_07705 [Pseudomonas juntendi]|uniref:Uncharacterized protein n=1 Tax=Pseudomonas juntendi TaxID=2666183 RepID=A0A7W2LK30_9PSED|nr:hypothetical protein [Pseudomonas juntendi]MBA6142356.1 hypothetical protein [Pseudomonas juntendi]